MTNFEWAKLAIALIGLLITCGTTLAIAVRVITTRELATQKLVTQIEAELTTYIDGKIKQQEELFREIVSGAKKYIELVEKEMHQIEIWNRDHYVQKDEFRAATDGLRNDIKDLASSIKEDFKELYRKLENDGRH